ncbi:MAG: serine hydrolase domain-containing protein [Gammaproteobacteria bacterium]
MSAHAGVRAAMLLALCGVLASVLAQAAKRPQHSDEKRPQHSDEKRPQHSDEKRPQRSDESRVAAVFADFARDDTPGCAVGVARDGLPPLLAAYGMSDLVAHRPLVPGSVFNIASVSKQFTAFSILLLAQQHSLNLDDPVSKYLPELAPSAAGVTLRHLLHHTGGLRDYEGLLNLAGRKTTQGATQHETIELLGRQRAPNAPPGLEFDYSNTGYVVLGTVVERVSGLSLRMFEAQNIFDPLGMRETTVVDRYPTRIAALARGYEPTAKGFEIDEAAWEQVGDGQVHTTVSDLLRWAENFHTAAIGGADVIRQMLETGTLASGEPLDYASGVKVGRYRGLPTVRHSGSWAGYRAHLLLFPEQRFAVAVLCNRTDAQTKRRIEAIAEIFLGERMSEPEKPGQTLRAVAQLPGLTGPDNMPSGAYRKTRDGVYLRLAAGGSTGSRLAYDGESMAPYPLAQGVYGLRERNDLYVAFIRAPAAPARIVVDSEGEQDVFDWVPAWNPTNLADQAGRYWSAEAQARCDIAFRNGALRLEICSDDAALEPGAQDELVTTNGLASLRFYGRVAAPAGVSAGFELYTPGIRGLRFERLP